MRGTNLSGKIAFLSEPPIISDSLIIDGYASEWRYNHDSAITSINNKLYALWNATKDGTEGGINQVILQSVSEDNGLTWSTPAPAFSDSNNCLDPVATTGCQQWQPSVITWKGKIICLWDKTGSSSGLYLSIFDPTVGKWTANEIGNQLLPYTAGMHTVTRIATQTSIYSLSSGRLLCPIIAQAEVSSFATDPKWLASLYSDDDGVTWKIGSHAGSVAEIAGAWEPYITEKDGVILAYIRRLTSGNDGSVRQFVCASCDEGEHWSVPQPSGWDIASSRGASVRLPSGKWAIIHNTITSVSTANPRDRRALSVWLSDGGHNAAPAYCISGTQRGAAWSYPAVCAHNNTLAIISTRSQLGDGSARQLGVTMVPLPEKYVFSVAGQSTLKTSPNLLNDDLVFGGGECRFPYNGSVASLGGTSASVCITGHMTHRWGRVASSSPDGTWYIFDNRTGVVGFAIRIGGAITGENSNTVYLEYYSGGLLTSVRTSIILPDSDKFSLVVTISGTSVVTTLISIDGLVLTDSKTISTPTPYGSLVPTFGCANQGTWLGFIGNISAAAYFDNALSPSQVLQWHDTYGVRYGMSPVVGAITPLPSSGRIVLDPRDSLSSWPVIDIAPSLYSSNGKWLTTSGLFSLQIPAPLEYDGEITFRYAAVPGRTNQTPICTVGTINRYFTLYKSAGVSDTVYYLSSWDDTGSFIGRPIKTAQDTPLMDGEEYSVTIRFEGRYCIVLHDKCSPLKIEMGTRPQVFLGWGWRYDSRPTNITTDTMMFDTNSVTFRQKPSANEESLSNSWIAWTPIANINGSSSGITTSIATGRYRIDDGKIYVTGEVSLTNKGSNTGPFTIIGLPYPAQNTTGNRHEGVDVSVYSAVLLPQPAPVMAYVQSSIINFVYGTITGQTPLTNIEVTNTTALRFSFWAYVQGA